MPEKRSRKVEGEENVEMLEDMRNAAPHNKQTFKAIALEVARISELN